MAKLVSDNRKILSTGVTKPLNQPEPVFVEETPAGLPNAVKIKQRHSIQSVEDCWRIDDEWWRSEPVSRIYYMVILDSGRRMILYKNLIDKQWYRQT